MEARQALGKTRTVHGIRLSDMEVLSTPHETRICFDKCLWLRDSWPGAGSGAPGEVVRAWR
ncbi:hypothetical protein E2C01_063455 [Portunus trituberculatus]|uniref:Uncharacterized protein n=1 Tax=Portunus trituberculatus TaxID=210409 RepID=A0A5B7HKI3_PORTR|nr:hypothetical protein [Portunus trituberculatus]